MSFSILAPEEYGLYEVFVKHHPHGNFMQSLAWTRVKKNWQFEAVVSRDENGAMRGAMLVLILPNAKGDGKALLYAPRGPVCAYDDKAAVAELVAAARELAKRYPAGIFKADPYILASEQALIDVFTGAGLSFTPGCGFHECVQPRHNYMLTQLAGKTYDDLLQQFGRKTRYYVKMPTERGIVVKHFGTEKLDEFYALYSETGQRQEFSIRPRQYLEDFLNAYGENIRLYLAYYENQPLAGAITVNYAGKAAYVYGCSTSSHRELCPTYALQWAMIRWALDTGCDIYDMQGICIDPAESEQLYSVYQFKKKFNGTALEFAGDFYFEF